MAFGKAIFGQVMFGQVMFGQVMFGPVKFGQVMLVKLSLVKLRLVRLGWATNPDLSPTKILINRFKCVSLCVFVSVCGVCGCVCV
jgi:hypothetical protein